MYRVRKSWVEEESQLGAYTVYQNALNMAVRNPGYSIFDDKGKILFASMPTMSYKAKLKRKVGTYEKGEKVTVTRDKKKQWLLPDKTVIPDKTYLDLTKQIYDPDCVLPRVSAEKWINDQNVDSETDWLFWCSKYGQHVYIFQGSKGSWKLKKRCKCGTGNIEYGDGSDQGVSFKWKIWDKQKEYQGPRSIQKWNQHYSSAGGNSIHYGLTGKPSTHGCIALGSKSARWVFDHVPINSRVVVF